eukprot:TRINITY_DN19809_c0_g1_i1.p1 TRINITY_DN19809_c0_g1~~TRINITY_DN19809_c0_g1_i1.p1  ORF type:complete len:340 (-),score=86.76 TRINITY_DN19809_c0_g1_i1:132-1151(-)
MVWFQCEECGENLKKPKLQNHFRICAANRLSCIDCGTIFTQESVQAHTQCMSEVDKYGPKTDGKVVPSSMTSKKPSGMTNVDFDLSVGLSTRPPWNCSLCNVKTTSKETLLLHSEGRKHISKARAFHANKVSNQTAAASLKEHEGAEEHVLEQLRPIEQGNSSEKGDVQIEKSQKKRKRMESRTDIVSSSNGESKHDDPRQLSDFKDNKCSNLEEQVNSQSHKKSKSVDGSVTQDTLKGKPVLHSEDMTQAKYMNGETDRHAIRKEVSIDTVKWKKIIKSVLKKSPDGRLSLKKLQKAVVPLVMHKLENAEAGKIKAAILEKVMSSSRFVLNDKIVSLA